MGTFLLLPFNPKGMKVDPLATKRPLKRWRNRFLLVGMLLLGIFNVRLIYSALFSEEAGPRSGELLTQGIDGVIKVELLNGCGEDGLGQGMRRFLIDQGMDVVTVENAEHFNFPVSVVLDRVGNPVVAGFVAETLGIPNVVLQKNDLLLVDATVIIGKDFRQLKFNPP